MKCDKLKAEPMIINDDYTALYYPKESVDAAIAELKDENRRLKRALWLARAKRAHAEQHWGAYVEYVHRHERSFYGFDGDDILRRDNKNNDSFREWHRRWAYVEYKCKSKAKEYK